MGQLSAFHRRIVRPPREWPNSPGVLTGKRATKTNIDHPGALQSMRGCTGRAFVGGGEGLFERGVLR